MSGSTVPQVFRETHSVCNLGHLFFFFSVKTDLENIKALEKTPEMGKPKNLRLNQFCGIFLFSKRFDAQSGVCVHFQAHEKKRQEIADLTFQCCRNQRS